MATIDTYIKAAETCLKLADADSAIHACHLGYRSLMEEHSYSPTTLQQLKEALNRAAAMKAIIPAKHLCTPTLP